MSNQDSSELAALLALETGEALTLPVIDEPTEQNDGRPIEEQEGKNSGQAPQAITSTAPATLSTEYRNRVCAAALPALALGAQLQDIAADAGVVASVLRGWLISIDEPAYREALAGQVGAGLARLDGKMAQCIEDIEYAEAETLNERTVCIGEGKSTRYTLIGPELGRIAGAKANILSQAAKLLHWQGQNRLPKLFTADTGAGAGPVRASFSFVINGQVAPGGRIIQGERSTNEQAAGGVEALDITPVARNETSYPQQPAEVIPSSPAPGADPITAAGRGEKGSR